MTVLDVGRAGVKGGWLLFVLSMSLDRVDTVSRICCPEFLGRRRPQLDQLRTITVWDQGYRLFEDNFELLSQSIALRVRSSTNTGRAVRVHQAGRRGESGDRMKIMPP